MAGRQVNQVGQLINQRYEVRAVIGRGGQGLVYHAFDRWMEREVAVKVLSARAARDPQVVERLIREQQALSSLKGTSAVEVFDICRGSAGEICLVMELLKGVDLDEHLYTLEEQKERMSLGRVAEIFDPIVDTLEVAHDAGILHRDLKPANVFLLASGGVRLLDFGLARLKKSAPLTAAGTIMGSPSFMAPEVWRGQSDFLDRRADVYSLGVMLFRILAGELPFAGESLQEKLLGSTTGARPSLFEKRPDLPRAADDWVALALAIDREQRFANVRALWNAFLTTFRVETPRRAPRGRSFWAAARGAAQKFGFGSAKAPAADLPEASREPSFTRVALAESVVNVVRTDPGTEKTIELTEGDLQSAAPPVRRAERIEKTIELSESNLVPLEETLPDASSPTETRPTPPSKNG